VRTWHISVLPVCAIYLGACVTLAPGADKVRMTKDASDVAGCTAVGNVDTLGAPQGPSQISDSSKVLRNKAVGLGGNVIFVTSAPLGVPDGGVAYRCPAKVAG
jgi:hypothetical protein